MTSEPDQPDQPHHAAAVFDPAEVARVLAHVNRCHRQENLQLTRHAVSAGDGAPATLFRTWMADLDGCGVTFLAESDNGPVVLRLDFGWPASTLAEAGEELRQLYRSACRSPS